MKRLNTSSAMFLAILVATTAHTASAENWLDKMFTFREDQKHRIKPDQTMPPMEVLSPHYRSKDAQEWSRHYTRQDMQPTPYIDGSASLVMRPGNGKWQPAQRQQRNIQQNAQANRQGYDAIKWRAHQNEMAQNSSRTKIGAPGAFIEQNDNQQIARKSIIGDPVTGWDSAARDGMNGTRSRPGDYDYKAPQQQRSAANLPTGGREVTKSSDYPAGSNGNYLSMQRKNSYAVQQGDTLSGISEKDSIYGDWKMWPLIYDANRNQIKDPDAIYPKQNLGIPRNYTSQDASDARQRATSPQRNTPYLMDDGR